MKEDSGCFYFLSLAFILIVPYFCYSYGKHFFQDKESCYVLERQSACEGREFYIIHKIGCYYYSTSFDWNYMSQFMKRRYDVYCKHCIGKLDVPIFNSYHRKNYHENIDGAFFFEDHYERYDLEGPYTLKRINDYKAEDIVTPNDEERELYRSLRENRK